jgi:putative endonuclease
MTFWAYLLLCADGKYYTGHTDNLEKRMGQHQSGLIKGFTSSRLPVQLMWTQEFPSRYEALAAELKIKNWSKAKKKALITEDWETLSYFAKPPHERTGVSTSLDTNDGVGDKSKSPFVSSEVETPIGKKLTQKCR